MLTRRGLLGITALATLLLMFVVTTIWWREAKIAKEKDVAEDALFSESVTALYTDMEGRPVVLDEYDDTLLVVTTWASWCPQCAGELSLINQIVGNEFPGEVRVLALNRDEPKEQAQRFLTTLPSLPNVTFTLDTADHYFSVIGGYAMPETVIYNAAGEITYHKRGNFTEEELRLVLQRLLEDS
jgi:thiol-disulfide isomerase/thioredoxin